MELCFEFDKDEKFYRNLILLQKLKKDSIPRLIQLQVVYLYKKGYCHKLLIDDPQYAFYLTYEEQFITDEIISSVRKDPKLYLDYCIRHKIDNDETREYFKDKIELRTNYAKYCMKRRWKEIEDDLLHTSDYNEIVPYLDLFEGKRWKKADIYFIVHSSERFSNYYVNKLSTLQGVIYLVKVASFALFYLSLTEKYREKFKKFVDKRQPK